jgi:uncharacterized protein (TIGR00730 family)
MSRAPRKIERIAVYCGSSGDIPAVYREAAHAFGTLLARRGIGIVYGGGKVGLMGVVADAALAIGGEVIGVIPDRLQHLELGHEGATELIVTRSMAERKAVIQERSDAAVALPGGPGTLDEFFEEMALTQLCYQEKALGLLNVEGFFDHLIAFLEHASAEGFVREPFERLLVNARTPGELLDKLSAFRGDAMNLEAKLRMAGRLEPISS